MTARDYFMLLAMLLTLQTWSIIKRLMRKRYIPILTSILPRIYVILVCLNIAIDNNMDNIHSMAAGALLIVIGDLLQAFVRSLTKKGRDAVKDLDIHNSIRAASDLTFSALDNAGVGIIVTYFESGIIKFVNIKAASLLGVSRHEMIATCVGKYLADNERTEKYIDAIVRREIPQIAVIDIIVEHGEIISIKVVSTLTHNGADTVTSILLSSELLNE